MQLIKLGSHHIRVKTSTIMATNTEGAAPAARHMITIDYFNLMSSLTFISNNLKTLVAKVDRLDGLMESLPSLQEKISQLDQSHQVLQSATALLGEQLAAKPIPQAVVSVGCQTDSTVRKTSFSQTMRTSTKECAVMPSSPEPKKLPVKCKMIQTDSRGKHAQSQTAGVEVLPGIPVPTLDCLHSSLASYKRYWNSHGSSLPTIYSSNILCRA